MNLFSSVLESKYFTDKQFPLYLGSIKFTCAMYPCTLINFAQESKIIVLCKVANLTNSKEAYCSYHLVIKFRGYCSSVSVETGISFCGSVPGEEQ